MSHIRRENNDLGNTNRQDTRFRDDWKTDDASDYEKSDVKKYIDEWFEKVKEV